jgi:hypothetical protein
MLGDPDDRRKLPKGTLRQGLKKEATEEPFDFPELAGAET